LIQQKKLDNGFTYLEVQNSLASAKIALQGAHIYHYERVGQKPLLWLSEISDFEDNKPIRGGVPVCWPWFGTPRALLLGRSSKDEDLPQHGFARTSLWELISTNEVDANTTEMVLKLEYSKESLKLWPYKFELHLHVVISDKLIMQLKTTNIDNKAFEITQALHTYFDVSHILDVVIKGLDKKPYLDALTFKDEVQNGDIRFNQEVDRVYQDVDGDILLQDKDRVVTVKNDGSSSVVIWNPWHEKCSRMSAMNDDAYKDMVCIESANAFDDAKLIKPNESHTLKATIF
jgi:glucose-6-phosphate 1-epimerase